MKLAELTFEKPITGPVENLTGSAGLESIISTVIGFLTLIGGLFFLIMFIIGAYGWINSEGKPDKLETARNRITQAITGLIILVGAFAITAIITNLLGLNIFDLQEAIENITIN